MVLFSYLEKNPQKKRKARRVTSSLSKNPKRFSLLQTEVPSSMNLASLHFPKDSLPKEAEFDQLCFSRLAVDIGTICSILALLLVFKSSNHEVIATPITIVGFVSELIISSTLAIINHSSIKIIWVCGCVYIYNYAHVCMHVCEHCPSSNPSANAMQCVFLVQNCYDEH